LLFNGLFAFVVGVPRPYFHDEFSYLLAADTFANSRLANPAHPFWQHFETIHVIQQPTYASKYPPAPGLFKAAGQLFAGQPIVGVWLATALACSAVTWALMQWLPRRWATIGGLLATFHPIVLEWSQSYWGGSFAMLGGALLLGGAAALARRLCPGSAVALAAGMALLANTRPFEGLVLTVLVLASLGVYLLRRGRVNLKSVVIRVVAPSAAVLVAVAACMLYYNYRVTGSPLKLPYIVHEEQYGLAPLFVFQPEKPKPAYRHAVIEQYHEGWALNLWYRPQQTLGGFVSYTLDKLELIASRYCLHTVLAIPLVCALLALRQSRRVRVGVALLLAFILCLLPATWVLPHYVAPAFPLLLYLCAAGLRSVSLWRWGGRRVGSAVVAIAMLTFVTGVAYDAWALAAPALGIRPRTLAIELPSQRDAVVEAARQYGERALIFVRYGPNKPRDYEWVYNAADIDAAPVVWAREISPEQDRRLIEHFADRHVLRLDVSGHESNLSLLRPPTRR
jgi:hypothetical protein